jgi:Mg2+/Co2+ transporter CorB
MDHRDVEQLPRRVQPIAPKLMHEQLVRHPHYEGANHVSILHVREVIALLGEAMDVLTKSFSYLLLAVPEILGVT